MHSEDEDDGILQTELGFLPGGEQGVKQTRLSRIEIRNMKTSHVVLQIDLHETDIIEIYRVSLFVLLLGN